MNADAPALQRQRHRVDVLPREIDVEQRAIDLDVLRPSPVPRSSDITGPSTCGAGIFEGELQVDRHQRFVFDEKNAQAQQFLAAIALGLRQAAKGRGSGGVLVGQGKRECCILRPSQSTDGLREVVKSGSRLHPTLSRQWDREDLHMRPLSGQLSRSMPCRPVCCAAIAVRREPKPAFPGIAGSAWSNPPVWTHGAGSSAGGNAGPPVSIQLERQISCHRPGCAVAYLPG